MRKYAFLYLGLAALCGYVQEHYVLNNGTSHSALFGFLLSVPFAFLTSAMSPLLRGKTSHEASIWSHSARSFSILWAGMLVSFLLGALASFGGDGYGRVVNFASVERGELIACMAWAATLRFWVYREAGRVLPRFWVIATSLLFAYTLIAEGFDRFSQHQWSRHFLDPVVGVGLHLISALLILYCFSHHKRFTSNREHGKRTPS